MSLWYLEDKDTGVRHVRVTSDGSYEWVGLRGKALPDVDLVQADNLDRLVSARLVSTLRDAGFTGWEAREVGFEMGGKTAYLLTVAGRSSGLDRTFHDDHVREVHMPGGWYPYQACNDPAPDGWDGSSLFQPEDTLLAVATEQVHQALVDADLSVSFTEVGRSTVDLGLDDPDGHKWRQRVGGAPGERPGDPTCPTLLEKYKES